MEWPLPRRTGIGTMYVSVAVPVRPGGGRIAMTTPPTRIRVLEGSALSDQPVTFAGGHVVVPLANGTEIALTDDVLSQHVLVIGGIGQGKTNLIYHLLSGLLQHMGADDIAVVFDPKGDYRRAFARTGDVVVNDPDPQIERDADPWNLLAEVRASSYDRRATTNEIAHTLFDDAIEHSQQPFFPLAAKDLFAAALDHLAGQPGTTNAQIVEFWNRSDTVARLLQILAADHERAGLASYIDTPGTQTQGVLAHVAQVVGGLFIERFAQPGDLSIRELVRRKGGRCIFLEYDVATGKTAAPIYKVLVDLAIKESLSRRRAAGRVFFVIDEFRLLPHLMHMDHGVNFGRSEGARFVVSMQNVAQVRAAYGAEAMSILSAFNTVVAFRVTDDDTRAFVKGIAGRNRKLLSTPSFVAGPPIQDVVEGSVVEDKDVWCLRTGQAIFFFPGIDVPFSASIRRYEEGRRQ
jgi:type IV secretory pathway TraG/TraD family ATPase VirD4